MPSVKTIIFEWEKIYNMTRYRINMTTLIRSHLYRYTSLGNNAISRKNSKFSKNSNENIKENGQRNYSDGLQNDKIKQICQAKDINIWMKRYKMSEHLCKQNDKVSE